MKTMSDGYKILERGESVADNTRCIIEASDEDHEWESEYVGGGSMTISEARAAIIEMSTDGEWAGWDFRIVADDGDGCYCVLV